MIQTCNAQYWETTPTTALPEGAPCGATFDDFDHSVICPHPFIPGPSREEIRAWQDKSRREGLEEHQRMFPEG